MSASVPLETAHHGLPAGTRLNGIYEIDRMIGSGGMGEVYKGHEIQTGTAVAIKMLLPDMANNDAALALFRKEASALHYLMHDAIVRYFVFTVEPALQRPYLAMEFADGPSLSEILEQGPLSPELLQQLMRRVASGLSAAHERGIIHRDVSPDNIIIPQRDVCRAKIIDFGIARSTRVGDATIIGAGFAGKHNYVSPEQIGLFGGEITPKSDIYSLGLVLFHALTGQKLDMGGSQFQLVEKRRQIPNLGPANARFRPLLEQMLQPDPKDRPASMAEIENWNFSLSIKPNTPSPLNRNDKADGSPIQITWPTWFRYPKIFTVGTLLLAAAVFAGYHFFWNASGTVATPPDVAALNPGPGVIAPPIEPPSLAPGTNPAGERRNNIVQFIEQYDGGDCFLIVPVAVSANGAVLEGFGASPGTFDLLDKAFLKSQGFAASIGARLLTEPQCPAISFLKRLRSDRVRSPRIALASIRLRPGEPLVGTVENFANHVVDLLLISDGGLVQNMSYLLKPGTDALSFSIELPRSRNGIEGKPPQLVLAVASPRVIDSLRQTHPTPGAQFFKQALVEIQQGGISITGSARYFSIEP